MKLKGKKWIVAGAAAILVIAVAAASAMKSGIMAETAPAELGDVTKILKETGSVESKSAVTITAKSSGEVKGLKVSEGDRVKAGDLLVASGGTGATLDIKSQQAELSGLQAQYSQARELASKNKALYDQGAMSYEDYNASATAARQLASQIEALRYAIQSYSESTGAGGVTAPMDGVLTGVYVKEGESVTVGTPLLEISNLNDVYVKTDFIAADADLITEGDKAIISNEDANFFDDNGTVKKVFLKAEDKMSELGVSQKRVTVEVSFGTAEAIRLGSDVDVEIVVDNKTNVLRVPALAVFEKGNKNFVYVIKKGKAVLRDVETGLEGEDFIEIVSGLSKADTVIVSPGDEISDGVKVREQKQ